MNRWELLLLALALWTALGLAGTALALIRRERQKARRGLAWIAAVWVLYLAVELAAARMQKQRIFAAGQRKCFDEMCFSVAAVDEVPSFFGRNVPGDGTKLVRVSVLLENKGRGHAQSERLLRAYLMDRTGRGWTELPGLGGNPLSSLVSPGGVVTSRPVFRVPANTDILGLVLTQGHTQPGRLVIGDSDSIGHLPDLFALP